MSITYTYSSDWIGRDSQPDTSPLRVIKAADFLVEWEAIQTAFESAAPVSNPTFTGTVTATNVQTTTLNSETANPANWNTAYGWGDHASAGYALDSEVPSNDGSNASGTWDIDISGNAATATTAASATTASNCSRSVTGTGNLTGGGELNADQSISLSSTLTGLTDVQTDELTIGSWEVKLDGSDLRFVYNGTDVFRITTAGAIIAKDEVTAFGSP